MDKKAVIDVKKEGGLVINLDLTRLEQIVQRYEAKMMQDVSTGIDDNLIFRKKKYRVPTQSFGLYFVDSLSKYDDSITAPWMAKKKRFEVSGIWGKSFLLYQFYLK